MEYKSIKTISNVRTDSMEYKPTIAEEYTIYYEEYYIENGTLA